MRRLRVLLFSVLLVVGCSTDEYTLQIIDEAESVMIEYPDSALNLMRSIDVETIRGEEDMAHYRLAMAEACYYNRLVVSRDSIAQPLFDYYLSSEDHAKRARALYQYALVMQSEGENARAMYSLLEAEKSLEHVNNLRLSGLVHRVKGEIYNSECLCSLSLEECRKEKELFDRAGLVSHSAYAQYQIGLALNDLRHYEDSIQTLLEVEDIANDQGDYFLQFATHIYLCYNYIALGDFASCISVFSCTNLSHGNGYLVCDYYCIGAILEAYMGNFKSAEEWLSNAHKQPEEKAMHLLYAEYMVYLFQGDSANALEKYKAMIDIQDDNMFNLVNSSLLQSQIDLLSSQIESAEKLQEKNRLLYRLSAVVVVIVLLILICIIVYRHKRHKREIRHYIETISDFELMNKGASLSSELVSAIDVLYSQSLNEINELCEIYYEQSGSSRLASKVAEKVKNNIERLKCDQQRIDELESAVNVSRNGIMQKLREQCPELSERDMRIALYTYAGFSNRAISLLVGCTSESLPKFKYSIRELIKSSEAPDMKMLTEPLYNKKHS